jgi:hypothetical protein
VAMNHVRRWFPDGYKEWEKYGTSTDDRRYEGYIVACGGSFAVKKGEMCLCPLMRIRRHLGREGPSAQHSHEFHEV